MRKLKSSGVVELLLKEGYSPYEILARYPKVKPATVADARRRLGLAPFLAGRKSGMDAGTIKARNQAVKLRVRGWSVTRIATKLSVSRQYVYALIKAR